MYIVNKAIHMITGRDNVTLDELLGDVAKFSLKSSYSKTYVSNWHDRLYKLYSCHAYIINTHLLPKYTMSYSYTDTNITCY